MMDTSYSNATDKEIKKAVKEFEKAEKCLGQVDEYLAMIGQDKIYDLLEDGKRMWLAGHHLLISIIKFGQKLKLMKIVSRRILTKI